MRVRKIGRVHPSEAAPYPTPNGVRAILDSFESTMADAKGADPENFIDGSFVQELDKSGWIAKLYQ